MASKRARDPHPLREARFNAKALRHRSTSVGLGCRTSHRGPPRGQDGAFDAFDAAEWPPESAVSSTSRTLAPRGRVLVLAADPMATRAVQCALEDEYDIVTCNDPIEALMGFVRGDEYDVVLCDSGLPFVPTGEFRDRVAVMNPALSERIVVLSFTTSGPEDLESRVSSQLDIASLRDRIAELVQLRTMPPCAPFRVSR